MMLCPTRRLSNKLSSSGMAAKRKREENKVIVAAQEKAEAEAEAKEEGKIGEGRAV